MQFIRITEKTRVSGGIFARSKQVSVGSEKSYKPGSRGEIALAAPIAAVLGFSG